MGAGVLSAAILSAGIRLLPLEREFIYPFLCWHCWALVPCMSSHTVMGAVIYPHGSTVGAREGLSQLLYGPSALKIAFICLLTLSL